MKPETRALLQAMAIALPIVAIVLGIPLTLLLKRASRRNAAEKARRTQEETQRTQRKTNGRQQTLGGNAYNRLVAAARKNKISNIRPSGEAADGILPIEVSRLPENGTSYSVHVWMPDRGSRGSYPVLEFSVDLFNEDSAKRLHLHYSPYGDDVYGAEEEFEQMIRTVEQYVRTFSMFPDTRTQFLAGELALMREMAVAQ